MEAHWPDEKGDDVKLFTHSDIELGDHTQMYRGSRNGKSLWHKGDQLPLHLFIICTEPHGETEYGTRRVTSIILLFLHREKGRPQQPDDA